MPTIINLIKLGRKGKKILTSNAAAFTGNKQYPSRQMHCKNDKFPPNSLVFIVITIEPTQMMMKIVVKTKPESFDVVTDKILNDLKIFYSPRRRHIIKGPHKSHCFNSFTFSSFT